MTERGRTIVFFPEGAFGPTNNCLGIGAVLKRRGHRVVFVLEESFDGTLEARGFEERLMRLKPKPEVPEQPGQFWKDFIRETAPQFPKPTIEQLETLIKPIWEELIDGASTWMSGWERSSTRSSRTSSCRTTWSASPPSLRAAARGSASFPATHSSSRIPTCRERDSPLGGRNGAGLVPAKRR